jgi:hypothetical protein
MEAAMKRKSMRWARRPSVAAIAMLVVWSTPVPAAPPSSGLEGFGVALSDDELSEMRGKYVTPDEVSFFGISLTTSWQDEMGITTLARLVFNVDFLTGVDGKPLTTLLVGWSREGDPSMDITDTHQGYVPVLVPGQVLPIGNLESFDGAAQANVIAGAGNVAANGLQIAIVPASSLPQLSTDGLQSITESQYYGFSDGDQLSFEIGENRLGLAMIGNNGLDSSLQALGGDVGQMLQQTMLNSDSNAVFNNATMIFGFDAMDTTNSVSAQEALSVMQGNGF